MVRNLLATRPVPATAKRSLAMRFFRGLALAVAFTAVAVSAASAQQPAEQVPERPKIGVGFQASWPAYGFSGIYDVSETLSGQAVLGFFGTWTTVSARGLARFAQRPQVEPYGYGMLGLWSFSALADDASTVSFGGGAGVDIDLRMLAPDLPALFWNVELGLSVVSEVIDTYDGAFMSFGTGLHYRF